MNAHQTYVQNLVKKYTPDQIAALIGMKRANAVKGSYKTAKEIHEMVKDFATPTTVVAWSELLAAATLVPTGEGWREGWEMDIIDLMRELPTVEVEAEVHELGQRAA